MKTLKIEIPEGFEIEKFDQQTGNVTFKKKQLSPMERIKTVDDILKEYNYTEERFNREFSNLTSYEDEKAYKKLKMLCEILNEGWEPDWSNPNQCKYYPWFDLSVGGFRFGDCDYWHSHSSVGSRLCFKSKELGEYAGKQFEGLYKQFIL